MQPRPPDRSDAALVRARARVRALQRERALAMGALPQGRPPSTRESALAALEQRRQFEPTDNPRIIRRGVFRYDRALEERRIDVAGELIRRVDPGPLEDPNYLAMLAYQAASIQMAIPLLSPEAKDVEDDEWSRYLLGTVPDARVNAFAQVSDADDGYTLILVNAALIDFIYQAAKSVVQAQSPEPSRDGRTSVTTRSAPSEVLAQLARNPAPIDRLYRTLEAYYFRGYPRAFKNERVPPEQHPPLQLLINMAERFVIAHEYGHGKTNPLFAAAPRSSVTSWQKELVADRHATITTVLSARMLDAVGPEFALAGGVFALRCLDLLRRALWILVSGVDAPQDVSPTHPPPEQRIEHLFTSFRAHFDAEYSGYRNTGLQLVLDRPTPAAIRPEVEAQIRGGGLVHAQVLEPIWEKVRERLLDDFRARRPLHPMWRDVQGT